MRRCCAVSVIERAELVPRRPGSWLFVFLVVSFAAATAARAQSDDSRTKPYATLDRQSVTYRGPVDTHEKEMAGGTAVIGMILPLQGPREAEGKALRAAALLALEEEQARGLFPDGRKLVLSVRDESGPWGQASSEILKLIEQDHAVVVLTSANGNVAHQAEQLANKISFPILTLASDPSTTETNVPWVFRLGPSDIDQARAFSDRIYGKLGLRKVLLIAETNHDGRIGAEEFEKVAKERNMPAPQRIEISSSQSAASLVAERVQANAPGAVVLWTDATTAKDLLPVIRKSLPDMPIFLCTKAAQFGAADRNSFTLSPSVTKEATRLEQIAWSGTTAYPGISAIEVYEAVHLVAAGLRTAGANRVLLRDYFASGHPVPGSAATLRFDPAGNCLDTFAIVELGTPAAQAAR